MGCDGGTIPKRKEIVKNKHQANNGDKDADRSARWQFCHLSGLPLKKPIVACQLGKLYNKVSIIEYLLNIKQNSSNPSSSTKTIKHIKTLKDVKELKLKDKPEFDKAHQATSGHEQFRAQFVCPISGLELNGRYKFYYIFNCGCVLSERALKEVKNKTNCISCSKSYNPDLDLIALYGNDDEVEALKEKISIRKKQQKANKKTNLEADKSSQSSSSNHTQQQYSLTYDLKKKHSYKETEDSSEKRYKESKRRRTEEVR